LGLHLSRLGHSSHRLPYPLQAAPSHFQLVIVLCLGIRKTREVLVSARQVIRLSPHREQLGAQQLLYGGGSDAGYGDVRTVIQ